MPHISQKKLAKDVEVELENRVLAFLENTSARDRYKIFEELFTETEKTMIAKRFAIIALIKQGVSTHDIADALGVSSSTVARFELARERGRFRYTTKWLRTHHGAQRTIRFAADLLSIPFEGNRKSLARLVDEQWAKPMKRKH